MILRFWNHGEGGALASAPASFSPPAGPPRFSIASAPLSFHTAPRGSRPRPVGTAPLGDIGLSTGRASTRLAAVERTDAGLDARAGHWAEAWAVGGQIRSGNVACFSPRIGSMRGPRDGMPLQLVISENARGGMQSP